MRRLDIPYEKQFHFADGSAVGSLDQLRDRIENISYQEFYHHVNAEKNDFASWIRHVLKDEKLAGDLEKVTSIVETVEILTDYLNPRPATMQSDDIQSKIEEQNEIHPPMDVEHVPTTTPAHAPSGELADLKLIEDAVEESSAEFDETSSEDDAEDAEDSSEDAVTDLEPENKFVLSSHEKKMLVVKDFIFGMMFGLILGIILGRVITLG